MLKIEGSTQNYDLPFLPSSGTITPFSVLPGPCTSIITQHVWGIIICFLFLLLDYKLLKVLLMLCMSVTQAGIEQAFNHVYGRDKMRTVERKAGRMTALWIFSSRF